MKIQLLCLLLFSMAFGISQVKGVPSLQIGEVHPIAATDRVKPKPQEFKRTYRYENRERGIMKTTAAVEVNLSDFQDHLKVGNERIVILFENEPGTIPMDIGPIDLDGTAAQTWTLPDTTGYATSVANTSHVSLASTGFDGYYPEVNHAASGTLYGNTEYEFYALDSFELFLYGFTDRDEITGDREVEDFYMSLSPIPLDLNVAFTSTVIFEYDDDPDSDSTVYDQHYDVVGYGTLNLPGGITTEAIQLYFTEDITEYKDGAVVDTFSYGEVVWYSKDGYYVRAGIDDIWNQEDNVALNYIEYQYITKFACTTWDGTSWNHGTPDPNIGVALNADFNTNTDGAINCINLTLNPSTTLTVGENNSVTASGDVENSGTIILENNASFIQTNVSPDNLGMGTYTVERLGDDVSKKYNYWSSPVSGITLNDAFPTSTAQFLYSFAASTQTWVAETGATAMEPGTGYTATGVNSAGTITRSFTNSSGFNSGTITHALSFSSDGDADNDWNLVGNPYPSAIDLDNFLSTNYNGGAGTIANAVYLWNSDGNDIGSTSADYAVFNPLGVANGGAGTTPTSTNIASCQGFFVQAIATGNVTFENSHRTSLNDNFLRTNEDKADWQRLWFSATVDGQQNEVLLGFIPKAKSGLDKYDAQKLSGNDQLSLYSLVEGSDDKWIIQGLPELMIAESRVVPIGITAKTAGQYTFEIRHLTNFSNQVAILLYDHQLQREVDLRQESYTVTLETGEFQDRFELRFIDQRVTSLEQNDFTGVSLYSSNQQVHIQFDDATSAKSTIAVYDLMGRLQSKQQNTSDLEVALAIHKSGIYIVKVENEKGIISQKVLIQ